MTARREGSSARVRRILLYSHDTYGLGHLRRNLRIAGRLLEESPELQVALVSGSPVADHFPTPAGLSLVKLPSVRKVGSEQYRPLDPRLTISLVRRTRTAIMVDAVRRFQPDVLLVDHSPAGMNGELLDVFATLKDHSPQTKVILGLRDILDDPATVVRTWTEQGVYTLFDDVYDHIVVYGSQEVFDVGRHYGLATAASGKLLYAGYIAPQRVPEKPQASDAGQGPPYVLATAGGGGDGLAVLVAAAQAGASLGMATKVIAGPLIDDASFDSLAGSLDGLGTVDLVKFHPRVQEAMAGAAAIVTMGGYNSLCEAISVKTPTVVVPRTQPRLEQDIRSRIFAERGLVTVVPAGPDLATRLARAVASVARVPWPVRPIDLNGLDRLASFLLAGRTDLRHGVVVEGDLGQGERWGQGRRAETRTPGAATDLLPA